MKCDSRITIIGESKGNFDRFMYLTLHDIGLVQVLPFLVQGSTTFANVVPGTTPW